MFATNQLETAFELLDRVIADESELREHIVTQQSRYHRTENDRREGLIERGYAETVFNNLVRTMDTLVKDLTANDLRKEVFPLEWEIPPTEQPKSKSTISDLERDGLQQQESLLQRKLNSLRQAQITAYDANQKFALEEQVKELEDQLSEIRGKLQQ